MSINNELYGMKGGWREWWRREGEIKERQGEELAGKINEGRDGEEEAWEERERDLE